MLARVSGGNSGIAEYLETGIKNGRDFTRNELDNRLVLSGDLELTNKVIDSIQDKGQDRYLHITLSFREDQISPDTLKSVVDEYKNSLMSAFQEDEFNFYAEAHLPKIKNIMDNKTGEMISRKPHIHIVIPKTNLLSGKALNPFGKYTQSVKYHDAIQETINQKYKLESPKDFIRQDDDFQASMISRIKGDFYKEKQGDIKREILYKVQSTCVNTIDDFKSVVSTFGEVKVRNAGKRNQYFAVKLAGDQKFTNLKSPVFSKQYIEHRILQLEQPTPKQIEARLETWKNITSREIKFIANATPKFREIYRDASVTLKRELLTERENAYEKRYRESNHQGASGRQGYNKSGIKRVKSSDIARYSHGLPSMPQRNVVYGIRGKEYGINQAERILLDNEVGDLADERNKEYQRPELRRFGNESRTGGINTANVISQSYRNNLENNKQQNDLSHYADLRKNLDPQRLLNSLSLTHKINPADFAISHAKDGSARINVGKLNLNVSDFLTKHMNIQWDEAKVILDKCYKEQIDNTSSYARPEVKTHDWKDYTRNYRPVFNSHIKVLRNELKVSIKELKSDLHREYQREKSAIYKEIRDPKERKAALSIALVDRLKREELIREYKERHQNTISAIFSRSETEKYDDYLNHKGETMSIADKVRNLVTNPYEEENSIVKSDMQINLESNVKRLQNEAKYLEENAQKLRMNDLIHSKTSKGIVHYKSRMDGSSVFEDRGDRIVFNRKSLEKEKIALGLEVAMAKYGHELKLTGSDKFKEMIVEVAAENDLKILLKPAKYQEMLLQKQAELGEELTVSPQEKSTQQVQTEVNVPQHAVSEATESAVSETATAEQPVSPVPEETVNNATEVPVSSEEQDYTTQAENEADDEYRSSLPDEQARYEDFMTSTSYREDLEEPDLGALAEQQFNEQERDHTPEIEAEEPDFGALAEQQFSDQERANLTPDLTSTQQDEEAMAIEYSYTGEGNKFVMSINGLPAADVIKERPEVLNALSQNAYLKQFSREELASGVIDETGKGTARDDVIDMDGKSIFPTEQEQVSEEVKPNQHDDMEM